MKATHLLVLQLTTLVIMISTIENLFENKTASIFFAIALVIFARCSIYINRDSKRLLKELNREEDEYKTTHC